MFTIMIIGLAVFSIIKIILFFYFYQQFERKQKRKVESNNQQRQSKESDAVPSKKIPILKSLESVQSAHFQAFLTIKVNLCNVSSHENRLSFGSLFLP